MHDAGKDQGKSGQDGACGAAKPFVQNQKNREEDYCLQNCKSMIPCCASGKATEQIELLQPKGEEAPGQAATQDSLFRCIALKCPPLFLQECFCFSTVFFSFLPVSG